MRRTLLTWILGLSCPLMLLPACQCADRMVEVPTGEDPGAGAPQTAAERLAAADRAWSRRGSDACASALRQYRRYHERRPGDYRILWRLARAYYYWCDYCLGPARTKEDQKAPYLRKGLGYAEQALRAAPEGPEGIFWTGLLLARLSQVEGVLKSLHRVGRIRSLLRRSLATGQATNAAAHTALAVVELTLRKKGVLWVSGDLDLAISHLHKAIQLRPRAALSWIYLAEAYRLAGRRGDARATLRHVLGISPEDRLGEWYPSAQDHETRVDQTLAAALLKHWQAADGKKP